MALCTIEPRSVNQLLGRMSMNERIAVIAANDDRLEFLRVTNFGSDGPPSFETMIQLRERVQQEFAEFRARPDWWDGKAIGRN